MKKLKDICFKITDGSHNPPQGVECSEYMMLSSKNVFDDEITFTEPRYLSEKDFNTENRRTDIKKGDLLFTIVGTVGRVAVISEDIKICLQRSVAVLKPKNDIINPRFLMYQLQNMRPKIEAEAKGVAQKGIYLKQVENIEVSVPTLQNQNEIVNSLDKISDLICLRKQQISKLDELVKSRFIELFGDPNTNPMKWKKEQLQINATLLNGRAYKQDELLDDGKYPVLRVGNFFSNRGWYYSDLELDEDKYCDDGDLLYAWSASFGPRIWNGGKVIYHYHIWKVLVGEKYNKQFLCHLLDYATASFMGDTHGIGMMHLTKSGMEETEFIVPLIDLQNQFAAFVKQTDKSKLAIQQSLEQLETLKKSLMQQYFG